ADRPRYVIGFVLPLCAFRLELQAVFTRRISQGLDPAMIGEAAAIERHAFHTGSLRPLCNKPADNTRRVAIAGGAATFTAYVLLDRCSSHPCSRAVGGHYLGVNMPGRAMHRK